MDDSPLGSVQELGQPTQAPQSMLFRLAFATGLVKTQKGAEYLLLGFVAVGLLFTFYMLFSGGSSVPENSFEEGQSVLMTTEADTAPF